tara:strand:+ start:179 stop:358 length:180 start_codon:yes stop_codon:yes gene_type:complete
MEILFYRCKDNKKMILSLFVMFISFPKRTSSTGEIAESIPKGATFNGKSIVNAIPITGI